MASSREQAYRREAVTTAEGRVEVGLEATVRERVEEPHLASAVGSGDVDVLATPVVLALAERAACAVLEGRLGEGRTSVGTHADVRHLAPTPAGAEVAATARLVAVEGAKLSFEVTLADDAGEIAHVAHGRAVVERERFLRTARERAGD